MRLLATLMSNAYVPIAVVVFFGVTIFVHEFGHYIVARLCGLVVRTFSIGFGPALWKRTRGGVVYKIGAIPFGGYVALPQLDPSGMSTIQGEEGDKEGEKPLPRVSPWKKILVSLAGASGNVILALIIAWLVYLVGMPATTANQDTVVGYVDAESAAYVAGLRTGDRIMAVNDVEVEKWSTFIQEASMADNVALRVLGADGAERTVAVATEEWQYGVQMVEGIDCRGRCEVGSVSPGMSAEKAGMQAGDVIVEFAGSEVLSRRHLIDLVEGHRDQAVPVVVARKTDGVTARLDLVVTPEFDAQAQMTRIGIVFERIVSAVDTDVRVHPRPLDQLRHHSKAIFRFLGSLVTPRKARRAASMVGGPVAIVTYYVGMVKASLMLAVCFTGFLNVNLAIINLLPVPVLDGGHIVFSLWEAVTRRPPHARIVNILVNAFSVLIICVFVLLSLRDFDRHTPVGRFVRGLFSSEKEMVEQEQTTEAEQPVEPGQEGVP